jgi:hypothetical protein
MDFKGLLKKYGCSKEGDQSISGPKSRNLCTKFSSKSHIVKIISDPDPIMPKSVGSGSALLALSDK